MGNYQPLPKENAFSLVELVGVASHDFGHRLFSRSFKPMAVGTTKMTLFLSPEGKVLSMFFALKDEDRLSLFVQKDLQDELVKLIEHYHFSEKFEATRHEPILSEWKPALEGDGTNESYSKNGVLEVCAMKTHFRFRRDPSPEDGKAGPWIEHRIRNLIPDLRMDFSSPPLVFEAGLDSYCDEGKGCYIGQEVVERVRSRGGNIPKKLASFEWDGIVQAEEKVFTANLEREIGNVSRTVAMISEIRSISLGLCQVKALENSRDIKSASGVKGRVVKIA